MDRFIKIYIIFNHKRKIITLLLSQNSQLILRNKKFFETKKVLFFGNIKDDYPLYLKTMNTKINVKKYNYYVLLKKKH